MQLVTVAYESLSTGRPACSHAFGLPGSSYRRLKACPTAALARPHASLNTIMQNGSGSLGLHLRAPVPRDTAQCPDRSMAGIQDLLPRPGGLRTHPPKSLCVDEAVKSQTPANARPPAARGHTG